MSDTSQGEGWWIASDGKWYAPEQHPDHVSLPTPVRPTAPLDPAVAETVAIPAAATDTPGPAFTAPGAPGPVTETYEGQLLADPDYDLPATDAPASRRNLVLGLGAAVLLVGLGFLAFRFFTGGSAAGGAASPEAAIDQLIASVNERDAVGFVDVFDPDEIEAWFGSFTPAFDEFENVNSQGETSNEISEAYASAFDSFDYALTGPRGGAVTYQLEPLDDDGRITRVRLNGLEFEVMVDDTDTAVIAAFGGDPDALDVGAFDGARAEFIDERGGLAARLFIPSDSSDIDEFIPDAHLDLVTIQKDGKWFVSIGYSFLEIARGQGAFDDFPRPDFGRGFELVESQTGGGESPEGVVQSLFDSLEALDYETIIELTDPYATPYLHDYQPLIDSQVDQGDRQEAVREAGLRFDDLELGTAEWQGRTLVTLGSVNGRANAGTFMLDTDSWCVTVEDEFDRERVCAEDGIADLLREADSDLDPRDFIPEATGMIVVERNGRWYLDPLGTMGYYTDQLAESGVALSNEIEGNPATELGDFFFAEGPIASQGTPATQQAQAGSAGVALDLSDYPTVGDDFSEFHVAVARVVTDGPGTFVTYQDPELDGEEWLLVYDSNLDNPELPAIAASTDGRLDVELFEAPIVEFDTDGYTGQLGGQGRPQVVIYTGDAFDVDIQVDGATSQTVFGWEDHGVLYPEERFPSPPTASAAFSVIIGEPGATYTISVTSYESEPEPEYEPELEPEPQPFAEDERVLDQFATLVEAESFFFVKDQAGGFFDGCGGPNDPDVTSYVFEEDGGTLMVLTPYPSRERAMAAFDALFNVASPCEAFSGIEVNSIETAGSDVIIEWQQSGDPSSVVFELYRLDGGSNIVIATERSVAGLLDQINILDEWDLAN